ncbi:hypothetical protein [Halobellus sp. H-GB7]|uniref:hypothetical protein n=1 Tax=Halobellus sp. H-GB7 TaxID=3069756 RepID=UPI0027B17108|nr:hypothetical protein [Halobellus sp. H-GB7]MDQ2055863.1 hypothetical protein [Halobellus sp. H-GB7]
MTWREQWPGEPRGTELDEGDEEGSGPFRIALKPSACEASPEIAALREESGEVLTYESEGEAAKILVDDIDCPGLQFQAAAPNDPAEVDAYLVKLRDPEPPSTERGPPEDGWTFNMRAQQVGALAEALFQAYGWNPPPIVTYAAKDLGIDPEEFRVQVNPVPDSVGQFEFSGGDGTWIPDFEFVVHRRTDDHPFGYGGPVLKRYIAEVKHGSTSFERNQRAQMTQLAHEGGPNLDVLIIRVNLKGAPQTYDLTIRSVAEGLQ